MTVIELFDKFPDEESARLWFENARWPDGAICPRCESTNVHAVKNQKPMPWYCNSCSKYFSVKLGTSMQSSRLPLRKWVIGLYLMTTSLKGVSAMKLHRDLGLNYRSAWYMAHRIREGWIASHDRIKGEVEVDEAYFGGRNRNRHYFERRPGRGTAGKAVVIGVRSRDGEIRAEHITRATRRNLLGFIGENVTPGSTVYTDEHRGYRRMPGYRHRSVRHSTKEFVNGQAHTNGIESFWAMLKRGYHGTYHHMSEKHLGRYVSEFAGRQSRRDLSTMEQMRVLARTMDGRRLSYRDLIRK